MAEKVAFDIAKGLVSQLSSPVLEQLDLWWNFKDDLDDLKSTISAIKAVILDAEEKSATSNLVEDWLAELKDALYDAEDLLDDVHTEALRKNLMSGNKLTKEVRVFFSNSNQFAYGLKMGRRIKAIKARFTSIQTQISMLSLVQRDRISRNEGENLSTPKLSYDHLPSHLKHCFAYCRLYPKDHRIYVQNLVQFWIAQGFIKQSYLGQSLEEIGFEYFKGLVERSFFQEVKGEGRDMRTCKMHDIMHDLAVSVAGKESSILDSNSSVDEIDEKCRHVSVNFSLFPLINVKKLRTLLCFPYKRYQNMSDATWNSIISNCRRLRVLELKFLNNKTIPSSFHKLKHLRYLDLSGNENLKILPKSICKTQNLQVLKLDWCEGLQELPKKIEKLVNLTHLACRDCHRLTHMPRGIGKLTSLQTLSTFVVDKDGSHGAAADISELGDLNNLRGELQIRNLGFVKNAKEEFKDANLKGKQHLRRLELIWGDYNVDEEKSLEDLQPHPNLKELLVREWWGNAKFPSWLSLLTNLTNIKILGPSEFKHLPSFAQLPYLKELEIYHLTELEYMDDNCPIGGHGEPEPFFPSLTSLKLLVSPNMKSWWKRTVDNDKDDKDTTVIGASTMVFPRLSYLEIVNCPLSSMPLYPSVEDGLRLIKTSSRPLKQTIQMHITPSTSSLPLSKLKSFHVEEIEELDLNMLEECLQNMTSLKEWGIGSCHWIKSLSGCLQQMKGLTRLTITDCKELDLEGMQWEPLKNLSCLWMYDLPQMVSLPLWLQHLVQLKTLVIFGCSGLKSLFPGFHHLTSLQSLSIVNCTELELSADGIQIFQHHTSLRFLTLQRIPKCLQLPEWLQHLTNLNDLSLLNLSNLTSLPDEMSSLTTLNFLEIKEIPQLEKRCQKDIGADWHKIAHIPIIRVNGRRVQ